MPWYLWDRTLHENKLMSEAGKIGPKKQQPWLTSPRRDQTEAAWAADYRLSPVAQVTLDRNGCIRRINVAAAVLLKAEPSQLTDIPFIAFVDKAHSGLFLDEPSWRSYIPTPVRDLASGCRVSQEKNLSR